MGVGRRGIAVVRGVYTFLVAFLRWWCEFAGCGTPIGFCWDGEIVGRLIKGYIAYLNLINNHDTNKVKETSAPSATI